MPLVLTAVITTTTGATTDESVRRVIRRSISKRTGRTGVTRIGPCVQQCNARLTPDRPACLLRACSSATPAALENSSATWHDRAHDRRTRHRAELARPRAVAPRSRPDRSGARAAAGRRGARPRCAHVGPAPSAVVSPSWSVCRPASIGARLRARWRDCRRALQNR